MLSRKLNFSLLSFKKFSAVANNVGIEDFLHSLTSSPNETIKRREGLESSAQFFQWLSKNKINSASNYIEAATLITNIRGVEQFNCFQKLNQVCEKSIKAFINDVSIVEGLTILGFVSQLNPQSPILTVLQRVLSEKEIDQKSIENVPFATLLKIVKNAEKVNIEKSLLNLVNSAFVQRMSNELENPTELLTLVNSGQREWFKEKEFVQTVEKLIPIMGLVEKCTLFKRMAEQKQRNKFLLGNLGHSIADSQQCLSISQITQLTTSCSILSFYQTRLLKKIVNDLVLNANLLEKWSDVLQITDSLVRMRIGNETLWKLLVKWAIQNSKEADIVQLSRFVSALAVNGIKEGKELAETLKSQLKKAKTRTSAIWLNNVYSLAYFEQLDANYADSILNKNVIEDIMNSSMEKHDRLRKAMMLLTINECAKLEVENYQGPIISKEYFKQFGILFNAESIRQARELKYLKNSTDCEDVFLKNLFKIAPQDTHCKHSDIEECGMFVDAYVMPDKETKRVVSQTQWGNRKPKPIMFFGWSHTKQNMEEECDESILRGNEQMGLRLLRKNGYEPVVVFKSEFDYCNTDIDKIKMLREKIQK